MIETILVAALVSLILLGAHEMAEHGDPPFEVERPGADEQWGELVGAVRRLHKHRDRRRRRAH